MKAAVVTFVRAYNYGASLQCYALSRVLRNLDVDVEVIDYYPQYFKDMYNLSYLGDLRYFPYRPLKNWLKFSLVLNTLNKRNRGFEKFILNNIPLSEEQYRNFEELDKEDLLYDVYISGSDQVWNNVCVPFDPTYFLQFNSALKKQRCSYAASFGFLEVPPKLYDKYKKRLKDWNLYSVREKSGAKIISELAGVRAQVCCDPTLLLEAIEWKRIAKNTKKSPYILVYTVNEMSSLSKYAKELSELKKIPVYVLTSRMNHESLIGYAEKKLGFHTLGDASPETWLGMFLNADYILSDSFHGTVFSLIFHKRFLTVTEFEHGQNKRAIELLDVVQLCARYKFNTVDTIDDEIDWEFVDQSIEKMRETAMRYIKSIISLGAKNEH